MTIIKSHDCKMCGGPLDIDLDRQVYICPFCGVTYDYEYFRADNVREMARKALAAGEFGAAKDAFEFIISKDPHDFEARPATACISLRNSKNSSLQKTTAFRSIEITSRRSVKRQDCSASIRKSRSRCIDWKAREMKRQRH